MTQNELLDQLEQDLRVVLEDVRQRFSPLDEKTLKRRPDNPKGWNILECFDHLNRSYNDYLPQIEMSIHKAKAHSMLSVSGTPVRYSLLGKEALRWAKSTKPKGFKTSKRYNPLGTPLEISTVKVFIINTEKLLRLIQMSREVDINRAKVRFAIIPMFKYKLGNLLEFITAHNQRHVAQAARLLEQ